MMNHRSLSMLPLAKESTSLGQSMSGDVNQRLQMPMQPQQSSTISSQPQQSQGTPQRPSRPGTSQPINTLEFQRLERALPRIPPIFLASVKIEAGVPDCDYATWTDEEKLRMIETLKRVVAGFSGTSTSGSRSVRPEHGSALTNGRG